MHIMNDSNFNGQQLKKISVATWLAIQIYGYNLIWNRKSQLQHHLQLIKNLATTHNPTCKWKI
jgi:hypothetical protein